jgi:hypothetical protein
MPASSRLAITGLGVLTSIGLSTAIMVLAAVAAAVTCCLPCWACSATGSTPASWCVATVLQRAPRTASGGASATGCRAAPGPTCSAPFGHIVTTSALAEGDLDLADFASQVVIAAAPYDDIATLDRAGVERATGDVEGADARMRSDVFDRTDDELGPIQLPPRTAEVVERKRPSATGRRRTGWFHARRRGRAPHFGRAMSRCSDHWQLPWQCQDLPIE